jgi:hypothetical protein
MYMVSGIHAQMKRGHDPSTNANETRRRRAFWEISADAMAACLRGPYSELYLSESDVEDNVLPGVLCVCVWIGGGWGVSVGAVLLL